MKQTNVLTEGAMAAAIFAALMLMSVYLPLISIISLWFLPLPFIIFTIRNGIKPGFVLWGVAFLLTLIIAGLIGVPWALLFGSGGLVVGWLYRQRRPAFAVLLGGSLVYTCSIIVIYVLSIAVLEINLITDSIEMLQQSIERAEAFFSSLGQDVGNQFDQLKQAVDILHYLAPSLLVTAGISFALITQLISAPVLRRIRLGNYVQRWIPFREWRFPRSVLWYYLIALLLSLFGGFEQGSILYIVLLNLFLVLEAVMVIQGFSFVFYFCHAKKMNKSIPIIIVVFSLLLSRFFLYIIRILGIIDLGFDLRKRVRSKRM